MKSSNNNCILGLCVYCCLRICGNWQWVQINYRNINSRHDHHVVIRNSITLLLRWTSIVHWKQLIVVADMQGKLCAEIKYVDSECAPVFTLKSPILCLCTVYRVQCIVYMDYYITFETKCRV